MHDSLRAKNLQFPSYREPATVDFRGIHLACIAGANGAGKSSILDSITWVLFGQSRSRSDDDLVNRFAAAAGETAEVSLTFQLEGNIYRVTRSKRFGKTGRLELQISAGDDAWKTLTESKIRETQAALVQLLRMNYDTFINASFLLQGKADEFTTKTANKRKEVLADLLGLSLWDAYKERTAVRRRQMEDNLLLLDGQLEEIDAELNQAAEREVALQAAQMEEAQAAAQLAEKEAFLEQVRKVAAAVAQQKQQLAATQQALARARSRLENLQNAVEKRAAEAATQETIIAAAAAVHAAEQEWQKATAELGVWQEKAERYNGLLQEKRPFELTIAREKSRLEAEKDRLEAEKQAAAAAAVAEEEQQAVLTTLQAEITEIAAALAARQEQEAAWEAQRREVQALRHEITQLVQERRKLQQSAVQAADWEREIVRLSTEIAEAKQLAAEISMNITAVRAQKAHLDSTRATQSALEAAQPALRDEMNRLKARLDQLREGGDGRCPVCAQPLTDSHRQEVLAQLEEEGKGKGDQFRQNKERLRSFEKEIPVLEKEIHGLARLEKQLQDVQRREAQAETRRQELQTRLTEWQDGGAQRLAALQTLPAEGQLAEKERALAELDAFMQERSRLQKKREALTAQAAQAQADLNGVRKRIAVWESTGVAELTVVAERLLAGEFDPAAQESLRDLDAQLAELAYEAAAHEAARKRLQTLQDVPQRVRQLQQAEAAIAPLRDGLADLRTEVAAQQESVAELAAQETALQADLAAFAETAVEVKTVEDTVFVMREQHLQLSQAVAVAQNRLHVLDDLRARRENLHAKRGETTGMIRRLKLLEKSFGRDGVQALLIEQALPEIEERANELLERLTGGEMRVTFATQRKLKSRDALAETLDIHISDAAGERPYDNFSGGEQFRVNFAIRLALSQLLARRAGARLQTLVIDEGFGSQDPEGRQRLVEAINTIRDDFARILVITHIAELRDAFPVRIQVEKGQTGSVISII